jgi:hypothetical protein
VRRISARPQRICFFGKPLAPVVATTIFVQGWFASWTETLSYRRFSISLSIFEPNHMNPENEIQRPAHRLHILHHAAGRKSVEQWMVDELAHHGYRLSLGSPYPMLHAMERNGYLTSLVQREERFGPKLQRDHVWQTEACTGEGPVRKLPASAGTGVGQ